MTSPGDWLAIDWMLAAIATWIGIGAAGLVRPHGFYVVARILFPLGALVSLVLAACALIALLGTPQTAVLPIGLPGLAVPSSSRPAVRFLPADTRKCQCRSLGICFGLLPQGRGHSARVAVPAVSPVPRQHGDGAAGRRRLCLHGDVGADGAVVVLPGDGQPCHSGNPPRRLSVPAGRAHRRAGDPALLRRAAGQHRRLHLRQHARAAADALLGVGRVPARVLRLRREGRHRAAACLVARRRIRPHPRQSRR